MNIQQFETTEQLDLYAANLFASLIERKPDAVLGLATGSTPLGIYDKIIEIARLRQISFSGVTSFNLDEYVGLEPEHEQSYACYMKRNLFARMDIRPEQAHLPNGLAADTEAECRRYESMLAGQPIDLQLLGLGHNGHIGFNEPAEGLSGATHVVALQEETLQANARFFASIEDVPRKAITMGVGSILKANAILLVARGADKAEIVKRALTGPITTQVPASLLQLHPRVTVLLDREAGRMLS